VAFPTAAALSSLLLLTGSAFPQNLDTSSPRAGGADTSFEDVSARAATAREAGRLDEAARLYREAVGLREDWDEGWWFLGTLAYEKDRHEECREAFTRLLGLDPQIGPAWALRGLCEFALEDYAAAQRHLEHARDVGPVADEPMWRVVLYHEAVLQLRQGDFERVVPLLRQLASRPDPAPALQEACGLRLLRRARLPSEIRAEEREYVRAVGQAECASLAGRRPEAEERFRALLERYPRERHLHYGLGLLLAQGGSAEAIDAFRREVELHPDHHLAWVELAFNLLKHGRPDEAVEAAEAAVRLDPDVFVTHLTLGRALLAAGDLSLGTFELESAARLAPNSPDVFFALARAYTQGGRKEDARRASARFQELDQARRSAEGPR
jgi:tetratricopeptide (TPR) repeat protein